MSCKEEKNLMELECSLFSSFRTYPDSTFFKSISCLYFEDGKLYMFDPSRADVAILDIDKDTFYTVGKFGEGLKKWYRQQDFMYRRILLVS